MVTAPLEIPQAPYRMWSPSDAKQPACDEAILDTGLMQAGGPAPLSPFTIRSKLNPRPQREPMHAHLHVAPGVFAIQQTTPRDMLVCR